MRTNEMHFERGFPTLREKHVYGFGSEPGSECVGRVGHNFLHSTMDFLEVGEKDPRKEPLCKEERRERDRGRY